ncbi:MAG: gas vesicle protein GvpN [Planctomycetota bacterium]
MSTATEKSNEKAVRDPASTRLHDQIEEHLHEALEEAVSGPARIKPEASADFVLTPHIEELTERALAYLGAGFPINLEGIPGTGKTTLALHVAEQIGRPVSMIHGDDQFTSADLIGSDRGYSKTKSIDNFIHSVLKTREEARKLWVDNRLTIAVTEGHTLIYDEFTRSRPEANNVLLSVLSEGLLNLPKRRHENEGYLRAHPEFRAIFTCNPLEYAGVHRGQDALLDRMIPIRMDDFDRETEVAITVAKSGIPSEDAGRIVDVVRHFREHNVYTHRPSVRAAIVIAKVTAYRYAKFNPDDPAFVRTCVDALGLEEPSKDPNVKRLSPKQVQEEIRKVWR